VLCSRESQGFSDAASGCVNLISSGSSGQETAFLDASESGDDVFFLTAAKLSPLDGDASYDVYDAHVCTSEAPCIAFPEEALPPCTTEASCKTLPTPQPAIFGAPASATFAGPGNLAPAPPVAPRRKSAEQIRIEKLKKALRRCRAKKAKKRRKACERAARKRYAKPKARAKPRKSAGGRGK
jgi:hypothetical protein